MALRSSVVLASSAACVVTVTAQSDALSVLQVNAALTPKDSLHKANNSKDNGWEYYLLDHAEVASRGSYCMDGSTPGYYYKAGTSDDKWTISFEGGAEVCWDTESCNHLLEGGNYMNPARVTLGLYDSEAFEDFHHVQIHHCDGGIWAGDADQKVSVGSQRYYFRGKRILDHTLDTLKEKTTLGSASDVLIAGGSGGGHATFVLADRVKEALPQAKKIGAVPMSGWYAGNPDHLTDIFSLQNMSGGISSACRNAFSESERYQCLQPEFTYKYSSVPTFVVQMLDSQSLSAKYGHDSDDGNLKTSRKLQDSDDVDAVDAWRKCMESGGSSSCDSSSVTRLQEYLETFVDAIKSISKSQQKGEGGFISTCTKHVFYKVDEYFNYANNGVTVDDAITKWWQQMETASAKWYLPCELNDKQPQSCQCEESCSYDSGATLLAAKEH